MTQAAKGPVNLSLLGPIQIETDGKPNGRDLAAQPKRLALLSFLAVPKPGIPQSRDRLLAMFWPEADQARARSSLRKTLYRIRLSVGGEAFTNGNGDTVTLDPST